MITLQNQKIVKIENSLNLFQGTHFSSELCGKLGEDLKRESCYESCYERSLTEILSVKASNFEASSKFKGSSSQSSRI